MKSCFSLENYPNKFKLCPLDIDIGIQISNPGVIHVRKIFFQEFTRGINEEKVNEREREERTRFQRSGQLAWHVTISPDPLSRAVSPRFAREQLVPAPAYSLN